MKIKSLMKFLVLLGVVTVAVSLPAASLASSALLSRTGGGESFGDGGYDSSGSSSGSGSSFDMDFGDTGFISSTGDSVGTGGSCGTVFCIILIVIIVVIYVVVKSRKGGLSVPASMVSKSPTSSGSGGGSATNSSMSSAEIKEQLKKLKEIDPKFDEQKFKTHAKKVFMAAQEGWTKRDQAVCRPFMAEEIYQSHQMQIDNMKKNKVINVLENIVVGSMSFARIDLGDEYHKIAMKVRAAMKDYKVKEDAPDVVIEGNKQQSPPFTEYWVFIRKSNLKTKVKDGIFDRKCPNCGAPVKVSVAGECKYCEANIVNGDYDWVLSEIVQKSEWRE